MKRSVLMWWIPAIVIAALALFEGILRVRPHHSALPTCTNSALVMDLAGDGHPATVRIARYDDDAWADVIVDGNITSTTRIGAWRDDASVEALDVNGDGRVDLVRRFADNGKRVAEVWLSDGAAFEAGWRGPADAVCVAQR
jgi:hypothetical protein